MKIYIKELETMQHVQDWIANESWECEYFWALTYLEKCAICQAVLENDCMSETELNDFIRFYFD